MYQILLPIGGGSRAQDFLHELHLLLSEKHPRPIGHSIQYVITI